MSTRGFIGFVVDQTEKIAYNHCDSYPEGLGVDVLVWLRDMGPAGLPDIREKARALRVIDPDRAKPTPDDVERLRPYTNLGVGGQSSEDWYCLLRETQGSPQRMLDAGVIVDASDFPGDSLFAEWGYMVDLDADRLEVYQGFQKHRHRGERFSDRKGPDDSPGYFPVRLVTSWPLTDLPDAVTFVRMTDPDEVES